MKYMGSKRAMLGNGLGEIISAEAPRHARFIDLFSGSGAVASHVAQRFSIETLAYDLQEYAAAVARATLKRTAPIDASSCWKLWKARARRRFDAISPPTYDTVTPEVVANSRAWAANANGSLIQAYGGHYFSPTQATWIESFRATLPATSEERDVCLAALLSACSKCAAAPGHTAQPFQPTPTATKFLQGSWQLDISNQIYFALATLAGQHSLVPGDAQVGDANVVSHGLAEGDLAFIDPPYSAVQYSRFYHVLEAVAVGSIGPVEGIGRYPPPADRPRSAYSFKRHSLTALSDLLHTLSENGVTAILTFPDHLCSNGISGDDVRDIAATHFNVVESRVSSIFSTLGGTSSKGKNRAARKEAKELILLMKAK
ncbi:DNA adenine methylase [Mitsuaria sp. GD03876]|uniref:DNA adenine methylase n=1 Tax=Mitsuaria sp. GD03876 TaxID=2975399 RepID=UPI00244CC5D0|nr:DNA adenine methylase [Mitsuaria sp. GD03876]MDH0863507.1 DNA adenine methylase [Mitsuaria sp. GD03876]